MGLQEGSARPDNRGEFFYSALSDYLSRLCDCKRLQPVDGEPDRIWGRGDGSFVHPKFTVRRNVSSRTESRAGKACVRYA
eukprot:SAG31_NODE_4156_length_3525_cov_2.014011_3_plen_80_part_00